MYLIRLRNNQTELGTREVEPCHLQAPRKAFEPQQGEVGCDGVAPTISVRGRSGAASLVAGAARSACGCVRRVGPVTSPCPRGIRCQRSGAHPASRRAAQSAPPGRNAWRRYRWFRGALRGRFGLDDHRDRKHSDHACLDRTPRSCRRAEFRNAKVEYCHRWAPSARDQGLSPEESSRLGHHRLALPQAAS